MAPDIRMPPPALDYNIYPEARARFCYGDLA
jgi:hypothetical protein